MSKIAEQRKIILIRYMMITIVRHDNTKKRIFRFKYRNRHCLARIAVAMKQKETAADGMRNKEIMGKHTYTIRCSFSTWNVLSILSGCSSSSPSKHCWTITACLFDSNATFKVLWYGLEIIFDQRYLPKIFFVRRWVSRLMHLQREEKEAAPIRCLLLRSIYALIEVAGCWKRRQTADDRRQPMVKLESRVCVPWLAVNYC